MNRISELLLKRATGSLTSAETAELEAWVAESDANRELYARLTSPDELKRTLDVWQMVDTSRPCAAAQRVVDAMLLRRKARLAGYAAAAIAVIAIGWWAVTAPGTQADGPEALMADSPAAADTVPDFRPGVTRALITDASGHKVVLSASDTVMVASEYLLASGTETADKVEDLCLDVPRGSEFKLQLEDGTEVWLNSDSRLYYPRTFSTDERRVRVTGEAYFSVATDSLRPFYVETASQEVRVYGTTFNVRNYAEEPDVYTTLEEGSIALRRADNIGGDVFLSPGHQASFSLADSKVRMSVVDPEVVTSWRKGRFVFENQTLLRIMQDLSRWYDFEYTFADPALEREEFMGSIPRYADFTTAIAILEKCGGIRFTVQDGRVFISN